MFLSIICQKGGVGKTTLSVNISHIFAKKGKKTLLIDLDPQGNSTTYLTNNKDKKTLSSLDLLSTSDPVDLENIPEVRENSKNFYFTKSHNSTIFHKSIECFKSKI